jgi:hypothetical protein
MYQKVIQIDNSGYVEISTRIVDQVEQVCLTLRSKKQDGSTVAIGVILDQSDVNSVMAALSDAVVSRRILTEQRTE